MPNKIEFGAQNSNLLFEIVVNSVDNSNRKTVTFNTGGSKTFFINFMSTNGNQDYYLESASNGTLTEIGRLVTQNGTGNYIVNYKLENVSADSVTLYGHVNSQGYSFINVIQVFIIS